MGKRCKTVAQTAVGSDLETKNAGSLKAEDGES